MIPLFKVLMSPEAPGAVTRTLVSGYLGQGPKVEAFEAALTEALDSPVPVLTMASGTAALDLALELIGVGPGDEVVTTAMTCTATNGGLVRRGATPVWADVDPATGNLAPASVGAALTRRTKAIMAVDWAGRPCDYAALRAYGLPVIEDAAHAVFARTRGQSLARAGGDYVCWSFQAIKHLTTGDGGAIRVPPAQVDRARLLRWYGLDRRDGESFRCHQDIQEIGTKAHMNDVAASLGLANLDLARWAVEQQRLHAADYQARLEGPALPPPDAESSWWLYTLRVPDREAFMAACARAGVTTSPVHRRNDAHTAFRRVARAGGPLPGLEAFAATEVAIPVGWWLSPDDRAHIIDTVNALWS